MDPSAQGRGAEVCDLRDAAAERAFREPFLTAVLVATFLVSVVLLLASLLPYVGPHSYILRELSMLMLGAALMMFLHYRVLRRYFVREWCHAVEQTLEPCLDDLKHSLSESVEGLVPGIEHVIVPSVQTLLQETQGDINTIRDSVATAVDVMVNFSGVLRGAETSGIVSIFPKRHTERGEKSAMDAIMEEMRAESGSIRFMGITLGDYFLDRGQLHSAFEGVLQAGKSTGLNVKALIVDPECEALRQRARWEAGEEFGTAPMFYRSTTFIDTDGAARTAPHLCEKYADVLEVRMYGQAPMGFLVLTSRCAFWESYNYAARGGNVPVLQIQAGTELYDLYKKHFDRIWKASKPLPQ